MTNQKRYRFLNKFYKSVFQSRFKKFKFWLFLQNFPYSEPVLVFFIIHTITWVVTSFMFGDVSLNLILLFSILGVLLFYVAKYKKNIQINTQVIVVLLVTIIPLVYFFFSVTKIDNYPADLEMHNIAIESFKYFGDASISNQYLFPDGQIANWYKTSSQYYPDSIHIFLASISKFFPFKTELLIIYFELYGTFVIWPYLIFKVLEKRIPRVHIIPISILFCSMTIFPLSTIAWGGVNFLYGQIVCLFFLFINGYIKSYKYIYQVLFAVTLFFIHPSATATFILISALSELSKLKDKKNLTIKKLFSPLLGLSIIMVTITYFFFSPLIRTQFAPSLGSFELLSLNSFFPIIHFFVDFFVVGSLNPANFGYADVVIFSFPTSLFLFYYFNKGATKPLKVQLLIICLLLIVTKIVGVNITLLHDVSRILTFPWNSHPNRFFSVIIIFMVLNLAKSNLLTSHLLSTKSLKIVVLMNFLYISLSTLNSYFV